eukprot:SAG25_NODE_1399_length_3116_cov_4.903547_1_plen_202_part_00
MYVATNVQEKIARRERAPYLDPGLSVNHPVELFKQSIILTKDNGPFVEQMLGKHENMHVSGREFWDMLCLWIDLARSACHRQSDRTTGKFKLALLSVPAKTVMCPQYLGYVWDLRSWWQAIQNKQPTPEIRPVQDGNENKPLLNCSGLAALNSIAPVADADILSQMQSTFDTKFEGEHYFIVILISQFMMRTCCNSFHSSM